MGKNMIDKSTPSSRERLEHKLDRFITLRRMHQTSPAAWAYLIDDIEQLLNSELQSQAEKYEAEKVEAIRQTKMLTLQSLLGSESGNICICHQADTSVCDHNWSLCNVIREELATLSTKKEDK